MRDLYHAICMIQADYARCIDDGALETWPDFFLDQCLYKITTADNHRNGYEAGIVYAVSRGMLRDRISALREANVYERHSYRHILGQPFLHEPEGNDVKSETPFLVVRIMRDGQSDIYATGRYLDVYRVDGNVPKLAERVVVCDSSRIDTLLALPL